MQNLTGEVVELILYIIQKRVKRGNHIVEIRCVFKKIITFWCEKERLPVLI